MPTTAGTHAFPVPVLTDPNNPPSDFAALAIAVSNDLDTAASAWTTWVPTIAGLTSPTVTARYIVQPNKTCTYDLQIKLAGNATGPVTITLPVLPRAPVSGVTPSYGDVFAKDISGGVYRDGHVILSSGATCRVMLRASSSNPDMVDMDVSASLPWASGDFLHITGTYERS